MWLINTTTLELHSFIDAKHAPKYAILSHCWSDEEMNFKDFRKKRNCTGAGYQKIEDCCRFARSSEWSLKLTLRKGFEWVWIDTVCIDKRSSAELSEAINSSEHARISSEWNSGASVELMSDSNGQVYAWYRYAQLCIAHLEDVEAPASEPDERIPVEVSRSIVASLPRCRWFTRGWTLQELIAPSTVLFVDKAWTCFGQKTDAKQFGTHRINPKWTLSLTRVIEDITGIPLPILNMTQRPTSYSVAQRLSWASRRTTTRIEDRAYCLLGLFNLNIPLMYGEGSDAFERLQREIFARSRDESIFAWSYRENVEDDNGHFVLGPSPINFRWAGRVEQRSLSGSSLSCDGNSWQLVVPDLPQETVFRHSGKEGQLVVRLLCSQYNPGRKTWSSCVMMLQRSTCDHYVRVQPLRDKDNVGQTWLQDEAEISFVAPPLDEEFIDDPGQWEPLAGPASLLIHMTYEDSWRCGRSSRRESSSLAPSLRLGVT